MKAHLSFFDFISIICNRYANNRAAKKVVFPDEIACDRFSAHFVNVLSKLKFMWNRQQRSTSAADKIHAIMLRLFKVDCPTRWNSLHGAFGHIVKQLCDTKNPIWPVIPAELEKLNATCKAIGLKPEKGSQYFKGQDILLMKEYYQVNAHLS